ncbi:MAG: acetyl-CoA hydrolase/transferase C-terminal domain-containing protein [Wenzhouxiangellaceae bacterium]|nr:acetyl-CoA hydrolase/transferase C-terminal domain-containing protein [Wenzhouxiangellaceae bacterium]
MAEHHETSPTLNAVIDRIIDRVGKRLVVGLPLGLGKPNRLINALYRRACEDSSISLEIVTALSLDVPQAGHWLQTRMMDPIVERLFGSDYPRLAYLVDLKARKLPDNVRVSEFYFASGSALGNPLMQRHYVSSNYTHVARDLVDRGLNVFFQLVARGPDGRLSLSSNPDVTLDLDRRCRVTGAPRPYAVAHVHPDLPFMHGDAVVETDFFDEIVDEDPRQRLFALPRQPVGLQDYAVGFQASRLVADGGTLQIGIGSLSDGLVHGLLLRQRDNACYREIASRLGGELPPGLSDEGEFNEGLFGASELFLDGFMHLYRAGILKREVFDDIELMRRANGGETVPDAGSGALMEGGFFLGSAGFYQFLRDLDDDERPRFLMHGVGRINQLYGGRESLEIEQRRHARFVNTCMMMTVTGAAVSDALADHQLVSGVGGQYNFVAMAQAMDDGRSALMLRATRGEGADAQSSIVWQYPHITIPRHLRDLAVTEYGIALLRGRSDEECIQAMISIADARFQDELTEQAKRSGKLDPAWTVPKAARNNTPEHLAEVFAPYCEQGLFPDYPFGSDFTPVEQRLIPALGRVKAWQGNRWQMLKAAMAGRPEQHAEELARLGLDRPANLEQRLIARLIAAALD